jgi:hypothetical protein
VDDEYHRPSLRMGPESRLIWRCCDASGVEQTSLIQQISSHRLRRRYLTVLDNNSDTDER